MKVAAFNEINSGKLPVAKRSKASRKELVLKTLNIQSDNGLRGFWCSVMFKMIRACLVTKTLDLMIKTFCLYLRFKKREPIQKEGAVGEVTARDYLDLLVIFDYAMLDASNLAIHPHKRLAAPLAFWCTIHASQLCISCLLI